MTLVVLTINYLVNIPGSLLVLLGLKLLSCSLLGSFSMTFKVERFFLPEQAPINVTMAEVV